MNLIVQIIMETETGQRTEEVARLERQGACLENVGLALAEGKKLLAALQTRICQGRNGPGSRVNADSVKRERVDALMKRHDAKAAVAE